MTMSEVMSSRRCNCKPVCFGLIGATLHYNGESDTTSVVLDLPDCAIERDYPSGLFDTADRFSESVWKLWGDELQVEWLTWMQSRAIAALAADTQP